MPADRPTRALRTGFARLAMAAEAAPVAEGAPQPWRLNSGAVMLTQIYGLAGGQLIQLIIDLESVTFEAAEIPMLREHWVGPIGRWSALSSGLQGAKGPGIYGVPVFYTSATDREAELPLLREADEVAALLARNHPWQASVEIGGAPEQYEFVAPGETVTVNGATLTADAGPEALPLYVLRGGICAEASVCLWGADQQTGPTIRAARTAALTDPKESAMDLKALLAKYPKHHHGAIAGMFADGKNAEQIAAQLAADDMKGKDDEIVKLKADLEAATKAQAEAQKAADAKVAELQAKIAALAPPKEETPAEGEPETASASLGAPKTITEGMARLSREGSKLSGFKLRNAVLAKWPGLRSTIPKA